MNLYTPSRYSEVIHRLALGVEPRDAVTRRRVPDGIGVLFEEHPTPLHQWREWPRGLTLDDVLPRMDRHGSGRFLRVYAGGVPDEVVVRVVDERRRYVPRRLHFDFLPEDEVVDAEKDDAVADVPLARRAVAPGLWPGAAYGTVPGTTGIRGRVVRDPDSEPARWCRVLALTPDGDELGWAHGDDRGEFLLPFAIPEDVVGMADDPVEYELIIGADDPPPDPDPAAHPNDPKRPVVDPLWDLAPEDVTPGVAPAETVEGREFLPGQSQFGPFPGSVPIGSVPSVQFEIP